MKGTPNVPVAVDALSMTGGTAVTRSASVLLLLPTEFVAVMRTLVKPTVVGVPLMTPAARVKPGGRGEAVKVMGVVPVEVIV